MQQRNTGTPTASHQSPLHVQIVLYDGAEEQDFTGPYEVFSLAGVRRLGFVDTTYVALDGPRTVTAVHGTKIVVDRGWSPGSADILIVPGGHGVQEQIDQGALPKALESAQRQGLTIASVCTGALLLSAAGLTKGRPCTTHHTVKDRLRQEGGIVKDARVVDDGDLVTSGGVTSGLDLALWLVQREAGRHESRIGAGSEFAVELEGILEYERRGTVWSAAQKHVP
ncbi:AraC family transcriptional regulator [Streptosporangium nondiastaticum]|uniref:AraC family transcriptional regulator n=1 Tax=Streptosporangium nondiastaticum TaxID=35764 RepID=A0A9X7PG03_9ACTN|nr:DJ-1/PfpI family protein [Streptosporangium nondiastaticum]PSJ26635.1 AraC family transcriptional regulator [Streptosporangium nondiastaticum]